LIKIDKFVYCVANGGLNDVLNQIILCYEYCKKHKRLLVVNCGHSKVKEDIDNFFEFKKNKFIYKKDLDTFFKISEKLTKFPDYKIDEKLKKEIFFDIKKKYNEDILIFSFSSFKRHYFTHSNDFFKNFELKEEILNELKNRLLKLPKDYISVHIRDTDLESDVFSFLNNNINNFIDKNIFLSSDNFDTIEFFKNSVKAKIFTFSNIPKLDKQKSKMGLHRLNFLNKRQIITDSILDLILLSLGKQLYCSCHHSGFSRNAAVMMKDKNFTSKFSNLE